MPTTIIDKTSPESYTTQCLLLLCQIIFAALSSPSAKDFELSQVLAKFLSHPLTKGLELTESQLLRLFNNLMLERNLIEKPVTKFEKYLDLNESIVTICETLYSERIQELEQSIQSNQTKFNADLEALKGI